MALFCDRRPVLTFRLDRWTTESVRDVDRSPDSVVEGERD